MNSRSVLGCLAVAMVGIGAVALLARARTKNDAERHRGGAHSSSGEVPHLGAPGSSRIPPAARSDPIAGQGTRVLRVRVHDEQGEPFAGFPLDARVDGGTDEISARSDEQGIASFRVPSHRRVQVLAMRGASQVGWAEVRAEDGSDVLEISLPIARRRTVWFAVRRGGAPFLPRPFRVRVDGKPMVVEQIHADAAVVVGSIDAGVGGDPGLLELEGESGLKGSMVLPLENSSRTDQSILELEPAGPPLEVVLRADPSIPPTDLILQRWSSGTTSWEPDRIVPLEESAPADGVRRARVEHLPAGRYRAIAIGLEVRSEEMDLSSTSTRPLLLVDASHARMARGRVEGPEGLDPNATRVSLLVEVDGRLRERAHVRLAPDGSFEIPVPGDHAVLLEARNPRCRLGSPASRVRLVEAVDAILLRLDRAAPVRIVLRGPAGGPPGPWARVFVIPADGVGEPISATPDREGDRLSFGGYAPGRHTLMFDDQRYAPLVIEDVDLGPEGLDLGDRELEEGLSLRVEVRAPPRLVLPRGLTASAERIDGRYPSITRHASGFEETRATRVTGLTPGTYRVSFYAGGGPLPPATGISQTVHVAAGVEAVVTLDFIHPPAETNVRER